ncbi:leucine-rich repeat-containing G-protein coupled receptor 5-like isoform X1 [Diorhabda sublineata]|uniref:leucine-rich repeat-containing G-protein coupled receptor 5-like isoform X1 n=2 Tax=Diorhabda sublineata TaxID=1163346 RepID=UPI0024E17C50|nr:leucine-rich repeat-containing G-protein coupled receptor 5-like isoform X1 [Diorhabda sublineata]
MLKYVAVLLVLSSFNEKIEASWEQEASCPLICTCHLEHLTETAIYRFMRTHKENPIFADVGISENNEILNEETLDTVEILEEHGHTIIRSAICILQTETDPVDLLETLPKNIESLTIIQGYESGNKTIKISSMKKFTQLVTIELIGPNLQNEPLNSHLICEIDSAIGDLKYLNLERVLIKNSKEQLMQALQQINEENITFEYPQKFDDNSHITIVRKTNNEETVVPYEVFIKQRDVTSDMPIFRGFKKLLLLRISSCNLHDINWEMFDRLQELQYLILEKNGLKFIPPFAFHGTPNLKTLSLAHNNLLDIQITDLAGLLHLEYIDLSYNNFTQLSELSFPPFPKLKLANFANNPINTIFSNTFEVMNTTNSLIIGSELMALTLVTNSLLGLNQLKKLTLNNLELFVLKRDLFTGMPQLEELLLTGNITKIEYDAFLEIKQIKTLILSSCQIMNISMDSFIGLTNLQLLDLSKNHLEYIPPGTFDHLVNIKELYLNKNKFKQLPKDIFLKIHPKLIRLNDNPWHCSCDMSEWKPMIINKIKQIIVKPCDYTSDKGISCAKDRFAYKYIYENKIAPKCSQPDEFVNWNVFHAMRRILRCADYKPKLRKRFKNSTVVTGNVVDTTINVSTNLTKLEKLKYKIKKHKLLESKKLRKHLKQVENVETNNNTNNFESNQIDQSSEADTKHIRYKKFNAKNQVDNEIKNDI